MNASHELAGEIEYGRIEKIVKDVKFPGYNFKVGRLDDHYFIQVYYDEPDVYSGIDETQFGRKWVFPGGQTAGQIVQTMFKAILTSLEHRAREHFTYKEKAVLMPHLDLDKIAEILPQQNHSTEIKFS